MDQFKTPKCLALFPSLDKLDMNDKYSVVLAFKKGSEEAKFMEKKFEEGLQEFFNGKIPGRFVHPFKDGDKKMYTDKETGEKSIRAGFEGTIYLDAKTEREVFVVDPTGKQKAPKDMMHHGRYVIAELRAYSWDVKGKEGFSFGLQAIQCTPDSESLPGGFTESDPLEIFSDTTDGTKGSVAPEDDPDNYMKDSNKQAESVFGS